LPLVYDELRKLAALRLAHEKPGQTLEATALVHEAYLRLVESQRRGSASPWTGRGHFFTAAAEAMRHILVDRARRKKRKKHGGGRQRVPLDESIPADACAADELLAVDEALTAAGPQRCHTGLNTQAQAHYRPDRRPRHLSSVNWTHRPWLGNPSECRLSALAPSVSKIGKMPKM
jgi:RNA polymerase sigma factor (TIGR02999 family)